MKMHENSMFAVLLRSPWWVSFAVAAITIALSRLVLAKFDYHEAYSVFIALPFIVIGCVALWRNLRTPNAARVAARLDALRSLSWEDFSGAIEAGFRHEGYGVNRLGRAGADLELTRAGRVSLVACKRWKVARTGVEPLRELEAARLAQEAQECIYIAAGEITDTARAFAAGKNIRLLLAAELVNFLPK